MEYLCNYNGVESESLVRLEDVVCIYICIDFSLSVCARAVRVFGFWSVLASTLIWMGCGSKEGLGIYIYIY